VQRIVGFKAGGRIGNLVMEPCHVLVEKYFRYLELCLFQLNFGKFREASKARSYHAAACKDWYWDGHHITAKLSEKSAIKTVDGAEPRKKYSRKKF
jgi:hypothetical protein